MVIVSIATIPGRERSLENTAASLRDQCDFLHIEDGTRYPGDGCKFMPYIKSNQSQKGIFFFCDDDLIYPPDYIETSIKHLERYPNAVFSYHGRRMKKRPVSTYYRSKDRMEAYRCLSDVKGYHNLMHNGTLGTGVMFFRGGTLKVAMKDFGYKNMADIWIAKLCYEQSRDMIVCPHNEGWIKYQTQPAGTTIWEQHFDKDHIQTEVYNSFG